MLGASIYCFFFFNDTATTEIYTLSLHDALPISVGVCRTVLTPVPRRTHRGRAAAGARPGPRRRRRSDRKSTRLNSSHANISYAVFCLKKKNQTTTYNPVLMLINHSKRIHNMT